MKLSAFLLALALAFPAAAMEGDPPGFPEYDPVAGCESVYAHNPNPAVMRVCIRNEVEFRDASLYLWPTLPPDLQTHCTIMAQVNGRVAVQYQTLHACGWSARRGRGNSSRDYKEMAGRGHAGVEGGSLLNRLVNHAASMPVSCTSIGATTTCY